MGRPGRTRRPGLSVAEAAHELGVSANTVRAWFDRGQLEGWWVNPGQSNRERRLDPASVEAKRLELTGQTTPRT
jgi:excisionase family DNA binding protein